MRVQAVTGHGPVIHFFQLSSTIGSSILNFGDNDFNEGYHIGKITDAVWIADWW